MSKIANNIWIILSNNTNVAKTAHALSNHYKRDLKLLTAILRYVDIYIFFYLKNYIFILIYYRRQKLDKEKFTTINVYQKYNIPNQGCDKGLISCNVMSNKCNSKLILNYNIK